MKKLISVLATVCLLAANVGSFAYAAPMAGTVTSSRNNVENLGSNTSENLPCFRPGDTLKFDVSGVTAEKELTLISYKYDIDSTSTALTNSNVQYINQYTLENSTQAIEYKIRENTDEGIYKILINGNDGTEANEVATFYYKVGDVKLGMVKFTDNDTEKNYYKLETNTDGSYDIAFIAKATINSEVSFADLGVTGLGIELKSGDKTVNTEYLTNIDSKIVKGNTETGNNNSIEANGDITFYYGVAVVDVPSTETFDITATAVEQTATTGTEGGAQ